MSLFALLIANGCTHYDYDIPDSPANIKGFERHFGFQPPTDIEDLYYFADEMGVDVLYQISFKSKPETVSRIVDNLGLSSADCEYDVDNLVYDFPWWNVIEIQHSECFSKLNNSQHYYKILWYNQSTQRVYYLEYSL